MLPCSVGRSSCDSSVPFGCSILSLLVVAFLQCKLAKVCAANARLDLSRHTGLQRNAYAPHAPRAGKAQTYWRVRVWGDTSRRTVRERLGRGGRQDERPVQGGTPCPAPFAPDLTSARQDCPVTQAKRRNCRQTTGAGRRAPVPQDRVLVSICTAALLLLFRALPSNCTRAVCCLRTGCAVSQTSRRVPHLPARLAASHAVRTRGAAAITPRKLVTWYSYLLAFVFVFMVILFILFGFGIDGAEVVDGAHAHGHHTRRAGRRRRPAASPAFAVRLLVAVVEAWPPRQHPEVIAPPAPRAALSQCVCAAMLVQASTSPSASSWAPPSVLAPAGSA